MKMKAFWFAQFCVACSLAVLLLNGCSNVAAQQKGGGGTVIGPPERVISQYQCIGPGGWVDCTIDVPPKEWDTKEHNGAHDCWMGCASTLPMPPEPPETITIHHMECTDKSRFKLMSEDGVWHCLALTGGSH